MRPSRRLVSNWVFGLSPRVAARGDQADPPGQMKRASRAKNGHFGRSKADNFAKMR
jgi:hypothetical protein